MPPPFFIAIGDTKKKKYAASPHKISFVPKSMVMLPSSRSVAITAL